MTAGNSLADWMRMVKGVDKNDGRISCERDLQIMNIKTRW